uniref:Sec-independent protein translocase component tatC n=1 Tax=Cryptomonas sp. CCAC 1634B TaxID=2051848 RepID=A0A679CAD5_9CRYP|nr:sec-independent protein translocase component tatC [Cryptomonas sp. CCAC 1634B]
MKKNLCSTRLQPKNYTFALSIEHNMKMPLLDHLEELRHRMLWSVCIVISILTTCVVHTANIIEILQKPAQGIQFLQYIPGEYLFISVHAAIFSGILIGSPFVVYQCLMFILPGITQNERKIMLPVALSSCGLFIIGIVFGYFVIVPTTMHFFLTYGANIVKPYWSLEQYYKCILSILCNAGLAFQLPIIQILLGNLSIVPSKIMISKWRYVVVGATILGAILTPSVDPLTQIVTMLALLLLYSVSTVVVLLTEVTPQT